MDQADRAQYAAIYRLLAEILERHGVADPASGQLSHALGDLTRRIFVGADHDPPDELLEQTAEALRQADPAPMPELAHRLRRNAELLERWQADQPP